MARGNIHVHLHGGGLRMVGPGAVPLPVLPSARHAHVTIEQHYSTEVVCGQLSAIYRELTGTQG